MRIDHCFLGDCRNSMREMLASGYAGKIQCIVTSPPYWGLRDYGVDGQLGLEPTPQEFVANMVEVFDLCRELLADDGALWLNLGDSYNAAGRTGHGTRQGFKQGTNRASAEKADNCRPSAETLKPKDLIAAYEAGDERHRTKAGLLEHAKRAQNRVKNNASFDAAMAVMPDKRNKRSVWTIPTESYSEAHFATFPKALVEPCILAGSRPGDIIFDPFLGSGTVAQVAQRLGRHWIGCELNPEYIDLQHDRTRQRGLVLES